MGDRFPATEHQHVPVADIIIGHRTRSEIGDISDLVASIEAVGLLHPIVLDPSGLLIAGRRRLAACEMLGWSEIPASVAVDLYDARLALMAERDENVCRLEMTPSDKVALGLKLEELERPRAAERKAATLKQNSDRENFPIGETRSDRTGKVYDLVGEAVGMSGPTYKRAKVVVAEAEAGNPIAVEAREEMNRTGKVTPAYDKVADKRTVPTPRLTVVPSTPRQIGVANAAKRRVEGIVGTCQAWEDSLAGLNVEDACAVADPREVEAWRACVKRASKALDAFGKRIQSPTKETHAA